MIELAPHIQDIGSFHSNYSPNYLFNSSDCITSQWNNDGVHTLTKPRTSPIPLDAPTQARKYLIPSATSRKVIPARFSKHGNAKGSRGSSVEDELDELRDESPPLDPNLVEQINDRRRRNAISARNSRRRRLQQLEELERERDDLLRLVHNHRDYVLELQAILKSNRIPFPESSFLRLSTG